jgi:hypothetical protein
MIGNHHWHASCDCSRELLPATVQPMNRDVFISKLRFHFHKSPHYT